MYGNYSFTDQQSIQKTAWEALQRQQKQQTREEERITLIEERQKNIDYGSAVFEEYTQEGWKSKVKKDTNLYNSFISEAEDSQMETIQFLVSSLLNNVNSVYEHININPDSYGFKNLSSDASDIELQAEAERIIEKYLDKNYYALSNHERKKIYEERVCSMSKDLVISEELEVEEALEHSQKVVVIEDLLQEINFPRHIYYRIQELMTSEVYGEIFEQEKLLDIWNDFKNTSNTVSRVFAALV